MRTIYRDCVVGIIISQDQKILMGMKDPKSGGVYSDCWHLPGGGIEGTETKIQALKREISEEVEIDITKASVKLIDDEGRGESQKRLKDTNETVLCKMKFFVFRIDIAQLASEIKTKAGDDIQKAAWFELRTILSQKLTPPSQEFFQSKMRLVDSPVR